MQLRLFVKGSSLGRPLRSETPEDRASSLRCRSLANARSTSSRRPRELTAKSFPSRAHRPRGFFGRVAVAPTGVIGAAGCDGRTSESVASRTARHGLPRYRRLGAIWGAGCARRQVGCTTRLAAVGVAGVLRPAVALPVIAWLLAEGRRSKAGPPRGRAASSVDEAAPESRVLGKRRGVSSGNLCLLWLSGGRRGRSRRCGVTQQESSRVPGSSFSNPGWPKFGRGRAD